MPGVPLPGPVTARTAAKNPMAMLRCTDSKSKLQDRPPIVGLDAAAEIDSGDFLGDERVELHERSDISCTVGPPFETSPFLLVRPVIALRQSVRLEEPIEIEELRPR